MINFVELKHLNAHDRGKLLKRIESNLTSYIEPVKPVIAAVRNEGDAALLRFAQEFDGATIPAGEIAATAEDFTRAHQELTAEITDAISFAATNIRKFHKLQMPETSWSAEILPGLHAGDRTTPIPSVACYIPRGKGSFPSSVLMTCIPASVAGVEDICIITPPGGDGQVDAATLVAAQAAGINKVYKAGGAQAIAAVAFGTQTISKYVKVVGPGSPWVVAAKRILADIIDTGTPAGPSESIIFADETTDGRLAALDLLIEAEHGDDSSAFLLTTSRAVADDALKAIPQYWHQMGAQRVGYTKAVLGSSRGGILLANSVEDAMSFINDYAPEHLQILSKDPRKYLALVKHAGEILLGEHTPSTLGNFVLGPSHVLPTSGWARSFSALSVHDFLKRTSIVEVDPSAYPELAEKAGIIAKYEGFDAHANAVGPLRKKLLGN